MAGFTSTTMAPLAATQAPASRVEGIVLLAIAWLAVIAAGLLAPILPAMTAHYQDAPYRDLLIGFVATGPALLVAVSSLPFGWLTDRSGARAVLILGMLGYGVAGTAPLWLDSLPAIAFSRAVMGVWEGAALTAGVTMIGLAFPGASRGRWLAAQVGSANIMGIVTAIIGGWAGQSSWRAPFWVYAFPIFLLPMVIFFVKDRRAAPGGAQVSDAIPANSPLTLLLRSLLAGAAGLILIALMVESSFLLASRGVTDSGKIGLWIASAAIGTTVGAALTALLIKIPAASRIAGGFAALAFGLAGMVLVTDFAATALFGFIAGVGLGLIVPSLQAAMVGDVPESERGRAAGALFTAFSLGQFISPPLFVAASAAGLSVRFGLTAAAVLAACLVPASLWIFRKHAAPLR